MVEQVGELLAKEGRDDGWWCLVGAQTMSIGGTHDGCLEQTVVTEYTHEGLGDEDYETKVVLWCLAWTMEQDAGIGRETPVVVLTGTVDASEGFLVQQDTESVMACHLLHQAHEEHVVVDSQIGFLEDWCQLKLVGRYLVVTCLARDAEFECLYLEVFHEGLYALGDGSEVMVVHLLVLG